MQENKLDDLEKALTKKSLKSIKAETADELFLHDKVVLDKNLFGVVFLNVRYDPPATVNSKYHYQQKDKDTGAVIYRMSMPTGWSCGICVGVKIGDVWNFISSRCLQYIQCGQNLDGSTIVLTDQTGQFLCFVDATIVHATNIKKSIPKSML